jgi:PEP-CTERM motif
MPETPMKSRFLLCPLLLSAACPAAVIYQDDFSGSGGASLNGATPDVTATLDGGISSATWSAHASMLDNGFPVNASDASALLSFEPVADRIYTLTVELTAAIGVADNDWLGFGFNAAATVGGAGATPVTNAGRFTDAAQIGKVWAILRETATAPIDDVQLFNSGTATQVATTETDASFDGLVAHTATIELATWGGVLTSRMLIDGTDITGGFQTVTGVALADINGVGITHNNTTSSGVNFNSFSLTVVPEPSAALLGGLGLLGLLRRRRA